MRLEEFLKQKYNYNSDFKDIMSSYIDKWKSWYQGDVKDFHNYMIYNGQTNVPMKRYTLNMAKEICEDWADILWSEKCKISLKDEKTQAQFNDLIDKLDLYTTINQTIEKSGAFGTSALVLGVYDLVTSNDNVVIDTTDSKVRVDIVDVDWIYPLSWNNKEIKECAFGSVEYINGDKYIVLSVHKIADDGNYHIYNHLFKETNGSLSEVVKEDGTLDDFNTKSDIKWFSIFKPLITNNISSNNPFGLCYYANAIDCLKMVDLCFDSIQNEVSQGKRRTFVRADMLSYDDGSQKMTFDKNDISVYVLPKGATKDDLIQADVSQLRTDKQIQALNTNLNVLGTKVGFGENHYHFDGSALNTATAVISSNSKLFRRKKKLEIGLESAIYDLVKGLCYVASVFSKYNLNSDEMVIQFDDSIIEDKDAESIRALREVNAEIMTKQEYREKIYGETPEIARQKLSEISQEETIEEIVNENND